MGFWSDLFGATENGPQAAASTAPEVRSDEPTLPQPHVNQALIIDRRDDNASVVSEGNALGLIACYRAVSIISTSVIQLSFDAYRDDEQIDPKPLILRRPDADENLQTFLEKTTLSLALNGNAFWRIFRDNQGRVTGLRVLNPHDVIIQTDAEGNVTGYKYSRRETPFTKTEVKHLSLMRVPGDARGRGPIQSARTELYGAINARDYANFWFDEAGVPTGILSTDQPLNADQAEATKARWTETQGGQRGTAILGQGFKYNPVYLSPEDAQWIQVRQFDTTAIARLFGVPAGLMLAAVEGSSQTYSNISQAWTEFQRFTLARYVTEIESAFSDVLPRGTEAKANYAALLAPDITTRYTLYTQGVAGGWLSINDVRAQEGLEPAPDGDFKTAEEKQAAFDAAQAAPGPGDTTADKEEASDES